MIELWQSGPELYRNALISVAAVGAFTFALLFFVSAPYGRHHRAGWGPSMPARVAWIAMEAPSFLSFALAACTPAALVFAWFTFCNLAPRAHSHHQWYRERFEDYPEQRKRLIPLIWLSVRPIRRPEKTQSAMLRPETYWREQMPTAARPAA